MSLKSLYKTFLWEGAYYGLLAAVIGGMAGSFCAMVIQGAQTGTVTLGTPPQWGWRENTQRNSSSPMAASASLVWGFWTVSFPCGMPLPCG